MAPTSAARMRVDASSVESFRVVSTGGSVPVKVNTDAVMVVPYRGKVAVTLPMLSNGIVLWQYDSGLGSEVGSADKQKPDG